MKKFIYLYLVFSFVFLSCSNNVSEFRFIPIKGKMIEVEDFELYIGENNRSVYLFIKDDRVIKTLLSTSLSSVEFRTNDKLIKGKLWTVYTRIEQDYSPFFFYIKKGGQIIFPMNFNGKRMFYIGELTDLAPEIREKAIPMTRK